MLRFIVNHDTLKAMNRRRTLAEAQENDSGSGGQLRRSLTSVDLILYGVGSSVGAGIFVLVGLGAKVAGPAITLSFLGCGSACILTSLAYAEFASRIPASGSAFTYVYVAFGEFYAWVVGWNLILGYGFTASVAARAWGDYTGQFIVNILPGRSIFFESLTEFPLFGHAVNYSCSPLSMVIVALSTYVLLQGAKESSQFNNLMTIANISILLLVIIAGVTSESVSSENLSPFFPQGIPGILRGAGLVFFAFIGFDMVASLSEEVVHPERNMPIGIVGSLIVSTLIYVSVSATVVAMAPFRILGETTPIVNALLANACCSHAEQLEVLDRNECLVSCVSYERPVLAVVGHLISGGAIFGLMASCFTSLMGQPRIFYRMAQDGLWFQFFADINPETQVPDQGIKLTGIACALLACFVPLEDLANLISLGTLMVFTFVDAGVVLLRLRNVSEESFAAIDHPETKEDLKKMNARLHDNIVYLLIIFTGSLVCASLFLSNSDNQSIVCILLSIAVIAGTLIIRLPESWTMTYEHHIHGHNDKFDCPWVPVVPLLGTSCNAFMMGSLPVSSWFLCFVWMACGFAVYFGYGIHNSTLGKRSRYSDTVPLMEYGSTGKDGGYESTLNISIREVTRG